VRRRAQKSGASAAKSYWGFDEYLKRAERRDRLARYVIASGGYGIIFIILLILFFLIYQSFPLALPASVRQFLSFTVDGPVSPVLMVGSDEYLQVAFTLNDRGEIRFFAVHEDSIQRIIAPAARLPLNGNEKILSVSRASPRMFRLAAGTSQGRIFSLEVGFEVTYQNGQRIVRPRVESVRFFQAESSSAEGVLHIEQLIYRQTEEEYELWVWRNHAGELHYRIEDEFGNLLYSGLFFRPEGEDRITAMAMNEAGDVLIAGTNSGYLHWFDFSDPAGVYRVDRWHAGYEPVTATDFLIGNEALIVGDAAGQVSEWFRVRTPDNVFRFQKIRSFHPHPAAVTRIAVSPRNRNFVTVDRRGNVQLHYATTGRTQAKFRSAGEQLLAVQFAPKSDAILLVDGRNRLAIFRLNNPHPEVTLKTLFGRVWYESYPGPEFVWQSTGGTDDFEPKLSLVPLIFGTFKGTLYAMLFSVPLAVLAAIYVSQFAPRRLAQVVKPTVEIMAALPSVVIGFLAGLYFSPLFERHLMAILLLFFLFPFMLFAAVLIWRLVPERRRLTVPQGWELLYALPFVAAAFLLAFAMARPVEASLFAGDIRQWLGDVLGLEYDTRNSLVVGFALGFAVIPIIFTMAEDALSNVPASLTSAALALGASRWQTVRHIVVPAASGGIFAGIMLGFGRAVGETMIVLMATGNTPILDLNPFNGFRAMSACIAVEIPEAPVGGTLYRVLFLTALLLFLFTFVINTVAAVVGDQLRKKYARF